ncbi:MAG: hypothetical protein QQN41_08155 [Nitrosopumilus sp.]
MIRCKLEIHQFEQIDFQTAHGVVGGFSMCPLHRVVKKCTICGKIKYIGLDIATNAHLDNTLNWK